MEKGKLYREYVLEYEYILDIRGPYKTDNKSKIGGSKPKGNWGEMREISTQRLSKGLRMKERILF